ncbi:MAG: hypothetical protein JXB07_08360 [Anaerolineae bacterium]|nr:hypothetical protein [Anaerolineae bacterium]
MPGRLKAHRFLCLILPALVLAVHQTGCTAATSAVPITTNYQERLATVRAAVLPTGYAKTTTEALTPANIPPSTSTPRPTSTVSPGLSATLPPVPEIDLDIDVPYLQDGGALPPGALARIGIGDMKGVAVYPDRSTFLLGTSTGLYRYRLDSFERIWRRYLERSPQFFSFSKDRTRVVAQYGYNSAPVLFDAQSGSRVSELGGWAWAKWSPDGRFIAVEADPDIGYEGGDLGVGKIGIFDGRSGELLRSVETPVNGFPRKTSVSFIIRWSPDGKYLAANGDSVFYVWDAITTSMINMVDTSYVDATPDGPYSCYFVMAFSPDGKDLSIQDCDILLVVDTASDDVVFRSDRTVSDST